MQRNASFLFLQRILVVAGLAIGTSGCLESEKSSEGTVITADPIQNNAPSISGAPATAVVVGNAYSFTPNATDSDNDSLTFSIQNKPGWASFSAGTGQLSGQPSADDVGDYSNIQISVSDGTDTASLESFTITVEDAILLSTVPAGLRQLKTKTVAPLSTWQATASIGGPRLVSTPALSPSIIRVSRRTW